MPGGNTRWRHARAPDLDPWREQDACGVGFVARASGERSHAVTRLALEALKRVAHRGAAATDSSGDGAGVLAHIPGPLFYREALRQGLPLEPGQPFAVGMFFLPREAAALAHVTVIIEDVLRGDGLPVLGWRDVPVRLDVLGAGARASCPTIRQVLIRPAADRLKPVIWTEGSASTSLDNALELLVRSGRDPVHALMMLVPEAHEGAVEMEPALRGFYEFHDCLVEPWDGPAALAFSDGVMVGSALDRNGLRPCRYKITRDGLVVAGSEVGLVDLDPASVVESGRLGPGELLVVDTRRKAILRNVEAKREVARRRPYARWAAKSIRPLRPTAVATAAPAPAVVTRQLAFGWSFEDLRYVLEPMGGEGQDAVWSMGDDTPIPPLARVPPGLYAYLRQRFAQVTNPPIDPLRETLVMSLR